MADVRLLKNGSEAFPAMFAAIDHALSSVRVEMYNIADDRTGRQLRSHLAAAARRDVEVRVLVDAFGSWSLSRDFWEEVTQAGGTIRVFRPFGSGLFLFRDHRKLLLVDNRIAFIGGMNIADEYYLGKEGALPWRDNMLEISGDDVVRLRRSFRRMWLRAPIALRATLMRVRRVRDGKHPAGNGVYFLESGPLDPVQPVRRAYRRLIRGASQDIDLAMGYFYPHGRILRALRRAAKRGVRVRLLFPAQSDVAIARWAARGIYGRLLRAGMEVWEYRPTMLHAKLAIIDGTVIAGSANLDIRSGRINFELVAVVTDPLLAAQARKDFEEDLKQADRISLAEWQNRPLLQRVKERISYWVLGRLDIYFARAEMARMMR
jgi:cardiolipin synthase